MDVSVIVCTYNRSDLLTKTLDSLRTQCVGSSYQWEVIVVDNNSKDDTKEVIHQWSLKFPVPITYLFEARQGKCYALNTGIGAASGSIIAFTDDDCQVEATWVQSVVDSIRKWNADGLGGRILPLWPSQPPKWILEHRRFRDTLAILEDDSVRQVGYGVWEKENGLRIWGANLAFRREVFATVGTFNIKRGPKGNKHHNGEEAEFVRRALDMGKKIVFDPTPVVFHHIPRERLLKKYFRKYAFDVGEGDALYSGVPSSWHLFGIRPYLLRILGEQIWIWFKAGLKDRRKAFVGEIEVLDTLGYISGYIKAAVRSKQFVSFRRMTATGSSR